MRHEHYRASQRLHTLTQLKEGDFTHKAINQERLGHKRANGSQVLQEHRAREVPLRHIQL